MTIDEDWIQSVESEKGLIRKHDIYPMLKAWVNEVAPTQILEVGCGQGICSDQIDLKNRKYTGIDLSTFLIDRANRLYGDETRRFLVGSAFDLPFPDHTFDAVISVTVFHLLSDLGKAVEELSRVLKEKGHFLLILPNPDAYSLWTESYFEPKWSGKHFQGKTRLSDQTIVSETLYLHSMEEILGSLASVRFKVQKTQTFRPFEGKDRFLSLEGHHE